MCGCVCFASVFFVIPPCSFPCNFSLLYCRINCLYSFAKSIISYLTFCFVFLFLFTFIFSTFSLCLELLFFPLTAIPAQFPLALSCISPQQIEFLFLNCGVVFDGRIWHTIRDSQTCIINSFMNSNKYTKMNVKMTMI